MVYLYYQFMDYGQGDVCPPRILCHTHYTHTGNPLKSWKPPLLYCMNWRCLLYKKSFRKSHPSSLFVRGEEEVKALQCEAFSDACEYLTNICVQAHAAKKILNWFGGSQRKTNNVLCHYRHCHEIFLNLFLS